MPATATQELTRQETAVLGAVGRRLSNIEIADEFHISVRTVESHIASLRRKLGVDNRSKLIGAAQARRGSVVQIPHNSFIGRDGDVEAVRRLLEQHRAATVVGSAGCGKTRLALELAAATDRVAVVTELEHAGAADVPRLVALGIGLGVDSSANFANASGLALQAQRYLLVLDNCDRVTEPVAALVDQLLVMAPALMVLMTSRSPVGDSAGIVYTLSPLSLSRHTEAGAVQLFLDRAAATCPELITPSEDDRETVRHICQRLDGLPLAIELAAARVRHVSLAELAGHLDNGFGPLDRVGATGRHRTLEAAFDWTWDLLDDDERRVLSRLAALPRTFDFELADAVTWPGASATVMRLMDRSLISPAVKRYEPRRFRLLDSLREFALARASADVVAEVRAVHAGHHLDLASKLLQRARTDDSRGAADEAKRLCPELNAAVDWALRSERGDVALLVARTLAVGGEQFGPDIDSLSSISRAARDAGIRESATAQELLDLGIALSYIDVDLVWELAELALTRIDGPVSLAAAHHLAGYGAAYRHEGKAALHHLEIAERFAVEVDDQWELASIRQGQGIALRSREVSDPEGALVAFEQAMQAYALAGDAMHVNNARYMMASTVAHYDLDVPEARDWAEECAAYATSVGNRHELAHAVLTRAALGASTDMDADLSEVVERFRSVGDLRCLTRCYLLMAKQRPAAERIEPLNAALDVTRTSHDLDLRASALELLVAAHWASGDPRQAAVAFGELAVVDGEENAIANGPAELVAELDRWAAPIAQGRARGI